MLLDNELWVKLSDHERLVLLSALYVYKPSSSRGVRFSDAEISFVSGLNIFSVHQVKLSLADKKLVTVDSNGFSLSSKALKISTVPARY